jgi:hypothetical protein
MPLTDPGAACGGIATSGRFFVLEMAGRQQARTGGSVLNLRIML